MKKIGAGLQFNVYDLGNGRVMKTPRSTFQMYLTNFLWEPHLIFAPGVLKKRVQKAKEDRRFALKYFREKEERGKLGNLCIKNGVAFQDKLNTVRNVLRRNPESYRKVVDKYLELVFSCWRLGFSDKIYNFTVNCGFDSKGNILLMDFGEITTEKENVEDSIKNKRWAKSDCYRKRLGRKAKKYYFRKMSKYLTKENLDKYWRAK
ncbi:MAG: hypothetical protein ABEI74_00785 [Candidatus Pacearchaeota archaeon]